MSRKLKWLYSFDVINSVRDCRSREDFVKQGYAEWVEVPVEEGSKAAKAENSGGSCDYYSVFIENPTTPDTDPYTAECNDVIEALDMTFAESNMFKEIWRTAAARTLGKEKEGHTTKRGAEKIRFFSDRHAVKHGVSK